MEGRNGIPEKGERAERGGFERGRETGSRAIAAGAEEDQKKSWRPLPAGGEVDGGTGEQS